MVSSAAGAVTLCAEMDNAQAQAPMSKELILLMMEWLRIKSMVLSVLVIGSADDRQQIDAGGLRKLSYEFQEEPTTLD